MYERNEPCPCGSGRKYKVFYFAKQILNIKKSISSTVRKLTFWLL
ncbi:SEC-C metal-binding domain-containing protein [Bacillus paramycoides]